MALLLLVLIGLAFPFPLGDRLGEASREMSGDFSRGDPSGDLLSGEPGWDRTRSRTGPEMVKEK